MVSAEAAYCSTCGAYVLVAPDGGCEHGHSRSSLRAVYHAQLDAGTGLPKPPQPRATTRVMAFAPPAPRVQQPSSRRAPVSAFGLPMHHDVASAVIWPPAFTGMVDTMVNRMFSPPKGKHSAISGTHRQGRGRHSAVVVRDARKTVVLTAIVTGSVVASVAALSVVL